MLEAASDLLAKGFSRTYLPFSMAFSMATPILSTYDKSRFPPGRLGSPYSVLLTVTVRRRPTDPGEAKKSIIKNFLSPERSEQQFDLLTLA